MTDQVHLGRWKSADAERRFRTMEDTLWAEAFPDPPRACDVETSVGATHVYQWPGRGVPVVFLHGMGGTAIQWWEYVGALHGRGVYAIDTMGDVGRSVQRVAFRDAAHVGAWLTETLAGLGLSSAHLVGSSYGGWLALDQAIRNPDRIASITLLDPVGLADLDMRRFLLWGACVFAGSMMPLPVRRRVAVWTRMPLVEDKRVMRMVSYGFRMHPARLPRPGAVTDDELRALTTPTLVLLGEKSEIHRSASVAERVHDCMPEADVEIVAGAGHALPASHTGLVCDRLNAFLGPPDHSRLDEERATVTPRTAPRSARPAPDG